jgi:hypothetical protein
MSIKIKMVDAQHYDWARVDSQLSQMLDWLSGKTKKGEVHVNNVDKAKSGKYAVFGSYGDRMSYVDEAIEFTDGSILLCGSVSSWGGTLSSQDNISVKYYALTPRKS